MNGQMKRLVLLAAAASLGMSGDAFAEITLECEAFEDRGYVRPEPPLYDIPYRCLYSANVPNLLMCGRCCSMTHRALGSMRVQSTCAVTGQAAGLAAANCVKTGLSPREYGRRHIRDLQRELLSFGQKIRKGSGK